MRVTTSSTNTKIPKFTLFKKLASLPDTSVLWSASSAARLWADPARINRTVGPSRPAKLMPRYARYCVTNLTSLTSNTQSAFVSPYSCAQVDPSLRAPRSCAAPRRTTFRTTGDVGVNSASCAARWPRLLDPTRWYTWPATKLLPRSAMSFAGTDVLPSRPTLPPSWDTPSRMALNRICTSSARVWRNVVVSILPEKCSSFPSTTASRMPDPICFVLRLNVTAFFGSSIFNIDESKYT